MSETGNVSVPAQQQAEPKKSRTKLLACVVAALVLVAIVAAAISDHQARENQIKQENDQLSHCIDLAASGVPNDQLPSYCQ